jgi:hypothetical protein
MSFCVGYTNKLHQTFVSRRDSTQFLSHLFPRSFSRAFSEAFFRNPDTVVCVLLSE